MKYNLPPGVGIIQSVVSSLDDVQLYLKKGTTENKELKKVLKESSVIDHDNRFLDNPSFIMYVQMLLLSGMSMFGGVSLSCLNAYSDRDNLVSITWDTGVSDSFSWGVYDPSFLEFINYYQDRLSTKPQNRKFLPSDVMIGIRGFLTTYLEILESLDLKISDLLIDKSGFLNVIGSDLNKDALFLVISSLPTTQLSRFFMFLNSFLPDSIMVKTPDGRQLTLRGLFDSPSYDFSYLSEKMKIFLDLYFNLNQPETQNITKKKTAEFLAKVVQNDSDFNDTKHNIQAVRQSQIGVRKTLYSTLKNHLDDIITVL